MEKTDGIFEPQLMSELLIAPDEAIAQRRRESMAGKPTRKSSDVWPIWHGFVLLNVAGLMLGAAVLRCDGLSNLPGVNGDEAWYGVQAELVLRGAQIPWRTPSGNLLNPFFFAPQLAMHAAFQPSFAVLRTTAVASGLLALLLNYWLCGRVFSRKIAVISTTLLAILPIDIAYSRIAWDASQSLLATLPCVYLPLWAMRIERLRIRCTVATIGALLIAIVVHPTNVFIAPVSLACLAGAWRQESRSAGQRFAVWCRKPGHFCGAFVGLCSLTAAVGLLAIRSESIGQSIVLPATSRIGDLPQYAAFLSNLSRCFSGATVYEYVSGAVSPAAAAADSSGSNLHYFAFDLSAIFVAGWFVWGLVAPQRRRPELAWLVAGWAVGLFAFYLVAGPGGLAPNFQRYAIWAIGPAAVLASAGIATWTETQGRVGRGSTLLALAIGWLMLFGFQRECLAFVRQTGGEAHRTFRTAAIEPKQAALAMILAESKSAVRVRIVTSEWWLYWPIRYLVFREPTNGARRTIEIQTGTLTDPDGVKTFSTTPDYAQLWIVEFTGSPDCEAIRTGVQAAGLEVRESTIADFAGRPLISVFAVTRHPPKIEAAMTSLIACADSFPRILPANLKLAESRKKLKILI